MARGVWLLHEFVSRVLAGGAFGCMVLVVAYLLLIDPFWGPPLVKKDVERRETAFIFVRLGLPLAILLGAFTGLAWRRTHTIRLSNRGLVVCCLLITFVSQLFRPALDRIPSKGIGPLYEVIPDTLSVFFCLAAVVMVVWRPGSRLPVSHAEPPSLPPGMNKIADTDLY